MIALAQALYGQQFASVADSTTREQLVVDAVRTFITQKIEEGAVEHEWVRVFDAKLRDSDFVSKPLAEWGRQFRMYERMPDFIQGQAAGGSAAAASARMRQPRQPRVSVGGSEGADESTIAVLGDMMEELGHRIDNLHERVAAVSPAGESWAGQRRDASDVDAHKLGHELERKDSAQGRLLDPLSIGATDCIGA